MNLLRIKIKNFSTLYTYDFDKGVEFNNGDSAFKNYLEILDDSEITENILTFIKEYHKFQTTPSDLVIDIDTKKVVLFLYLNTLEFDNEKNKAINKNHTYIDYDFFEKEAKIMDCEHSFNFPDYKRVCIHKDGNVLWAENSDIKSKYKNEDIFLSTHYTNVNKYFLNEHVLPYITSRQGKIKLILKD